jgi:hypothetical protein
MKKAELIATLNSFLIEQYAAGRKVLLIIDEAQNLSLKVLEEIRMLSGIESTKEKVLRIILAGQPELNEKLDSPELVQLTQRIRLRFHLGTLSREDLRSYVRHRLDVAGGDGREIFAEDTFPELFKYTGGVPRLINTLCDTAMMAAFNEDRDFVTPADIASAVSELQWVEFSTRAHAIAARAGNGGTRPATIDPRALRWCCPPRKSRGRAHLSRAQGHRPHAGQRSADRQQVHQPASLPARHRQRWPDGHRRPQQHQRHQVAASACAAIRCATVMSSPSASTKSLYVDEQAGTWPTTTTTCRASTSMPPTKMRDEDASSGDAGRRAREYGANEKGA